MNILFATSEAFPFIKTGGLGDVSGSLPAAIQQAGHDVRLVLPAYHDVLHKTEGLQQIAQLAIWGANQPVNILQGTLPGSGVTVWFVDYPAAFNRPGNPYLTLQGDPWPDNAYRFTLLSRVAVELAQNRAGLNWQADIVHCNDWQTALVPALLSLEPQRPGTVFTIHNLSYQGLYPAHVFQDLHLPQRLWHPGGLEYYGQLSIIKGGLSYADIITTVSPTYAEEIQHFEFGYGLEGLLRHRKDRLYGILNGVDYDEWNPQTDPYLAQNYNAKTINKKIENKRALQQRFHLPVDDNIPVIGMVTRLVEQKGIDLVINALPVLTQQPVQLAILGSGNPSFEHQLHEWSQIAPDKVSVKIGYNEALAHQIEGSADIFLMPSRFEPCGLNQMYSLRYGTVPIVRRAGGLADSVVEVTPQTLADKTATGITFDHVDSDAVCWAVNQALELFEDKKRWRQLCQTGMKQRFDWKHSAKRYLEIYQKALEFNAKRPG